MSCSISFYRQKNTYTNRIQPVLQPSPISLHSQYFSSLLPNKTPYTFSSTRTTHGLNQGLTYAQALTRQQPQHFLSSTDQYNNPHIADQLDQLKSGDFDLFLRIISLIQKYYIKCTNNLDKVKATILIVKELWKVATHDNTLWNLKFTLWNATSVKNKTLELHKFFTDYNTDIAIITES